jgi:hypothetical protein
MAERSPPPLGDVNGLHYISSISDSLVNEQNFNICIVLHFKAHNLNDFIKKLQNVTKDSENW